MPRALAVLVLAFLSACGGGSEPADAGPSGISLVSEPGTGPGGALGWTTGAAPAWTVHLSVTVPQGCGTQVVSHEFGRIMGLAPTSTVGCVMRPVCDPAWIVCPGEAAAVPPVQIPVRVDVTHPLAVEAIGAAQRWNLALGRQQLVLTP